MGMQDWLLLSLASHAMGLVVEQAFEAVKVAISFTTVMALPDTSRPFVLRIDTPDLVTSAVLQKNGRNIAFISKKLQGVCI